MSLSSLPYFLFRIFWFIIILLKLCCTIPLNMCSLLRFPSQYSLWRQRLHIFLRFHFQIRLQRSSFAWTCIEWPRGSAVDIWFQILFRIYAAGTWWCRRGDNCLHRQSCHLADCGHTMTRPEGPQRSVATFDTTSQSNGRTVMAPGSILCFNALTWYTTFENGYTREQTVSTKLEARTQAQTSQSVTDHLLRANHPWIHTTVVITRGGADNRFEVHNGPQRNNITYTKESVLNSRRNTNGLWTNLEIMINWFDK